VTQVSVGLQNQWGIPAPQADLLAHLSGGRPGLALRLSQNPEMLEQRQIRLEEHQRMLKASRVERFNYAEELSKDRAILLSTLQTWLTLWRDVMLQTARSSTPLTNVDQANEIKTLAEKIDLSTALNMVNRLERALEQIEHYLNARLVTEVLMLDLPHLA
jgi:DNA polymerase-3 subunit delta'